MAWPMPELPPVTIAVLPCRPRITVPPQMLWCTRGPSQPPSVTREARVSAVVGFGLADRPGRVDQPDVAEGLREVAQQLAGVRVDLFRQQSNVVDERDRPVEHLACPSRLAGHGERLGEPA